MDVQTRCICGQHPEGDTITLRDKLDFQGVAAIRWAVALQKTQNPDSSTAETFALLTEHYILAGVTAWTLLDEKRKPIPLDAVALRTHLLTPENFDVAVQVGDAADDLYLEVVLPLLLGSSTSSPRTPTTGSTSLTTGLSGKRQRRSKRSSITTLQTGGTVMTSNSLEPGSNLSPNSESAA